MFLSRTQRKEPDTGKTHKGNLFPLFICNINLEYILVIHREINGKFLKKNSKTD